ncbi:HNH endonuclease [Mycobacterium sp. PS03-16]|uniref:HNH endonuclease signature motif containing protein n=1 Tax=Mycobacterium sp. PS03-16 TaxID=2559611 RepID=UPI001073ED46|nr:HNH endonuclease signature motif containing protein [Mycobacterium sp. PS03-16]TFV57351.1 HNH endonuclease [Mycobacterium sp. PS03-16]
MEWEDVDATVTAFERATDALAALPYQLLTGRQVAHLAARYERALNRQHALGHTVLAALCHTLTFDDFDGASAKNVLVELLHLAPDAAAARINDAARLGPRWTLSGETLEPQMAATAAALARGDISPAHVRHIKTFLTSLPLWVDNQTRTDTEHTLARLAAGLDPHQLDKAAKTLLDCIDEDGPEPDYDEQQRKRFIRIGPQQRDGMSTLTGLLDPEGRALLDALIAHYNGEPAQPDNEPAQPTDNTPADDPADAAPEHTVITNDPAPSDPPDDHPALSDPAPDPPVFPWLERETKSQRDYDALKAGLRLALSSGALGTRHGLPASIVVTTTLDDLEKAAGYARTAGGTRLPVRDLIRYAAGARHYLAVFDDHTEEPLYLGRAKRCATTAQRLALFARDLGCTRPGCTANFYNCHAHHAQQDWAKGGRTDITDLALACHPDNHLIEHTGYTTQRRNGRTEWIPPPHLDTGQHRINHTHHPHRYLTTTNNDNEDNGDDGEDDN